MRVLLLGLAVVAALAPHAMAGTEVVASIAPLHSLVARVMAGAGTPRLLVPPGTSPHDFALRPSDAAALARAGLVFRVGPGIEPWLERPLAALAVDARLVQLDEVPGLTRLARREGDAFEAHEHGAVHGEEGEADPHLWLDPANARLWLGAIAEALAGADPKRAGLYRANAVEASAELMVLEGDLDARLAPLRGRPFVVFHDGFRYFEHRFGLEAAGAVALSDARPPGPARIAATRALIRETGAACVFREPQFRPALVETVTEGTGARIGVLDPLGATLEPGPGLYPVLLRGLAEGLAGCLG